MLLAVAPGAPAQQRLPPPPAAPTQPSASRDVAIGAVRSYRGDRTLINGFVRVPHELLDAVTIGAGGFAEFRLDGGVVGARGTVLAPDRRAGRGPGAATGSTGG